jgi:(1->4)-alpha-D-glucan 1-alpha-D-glucosylmutase
MSAGSQVRVTASGQAGHARRIPVSSYRLLLCPDFGFAEAGAIADYLVALGITHVCLSPILQAAPRSTYAYDVIDYSRISTELGGEPGLRAMAGRFRRHGFSVIVAVLPGHMAAMPASLNHQLWSVLRDGAQSPYEHGFDLDWAAQDGRLLLPILAGPVEDRLGDLIVHRFGDGEPVLRYLDHMLPVALSGRLVINGWQFQRIDPCSI